MLPQGARSNGKEEFLVADCDLTTARKNVSISAQMYGAPI